MLWILVLFLLSSCSGLPPVAPADSSKHAVRQGAAGSVQKRKQQSAPDEKLTGISEWDKILSPWLGTPYLYGGSTKAGADCSGFVQSIYREKYGMFIPRTADAEYQMGKKIKDRDREIGDLVFFGDRGSVNHVGIFIGDNRFIHASNSLGISVAQFSDSYWEPRYMGARRY